MVLMTEVFICLFLLYDYVDFSSKNVKYTSERAIIIFHLNDQKMFVKLRYDNHQFFLVFSLHQYYKISSGIINYITLDLNHAI